MNNSFHSMTDLFDQLGLPSREADIQAFIQSHQGLPPHQTLSQADFWTPSQARFLREKLCDDADWAVVIDALNTALHTRPAHLVREGQNPVQ